MRVSIGQFLTGLCQEGKSRGTVKQYRWHLERMADWLGARDVEEPSLVSRALLREWGASVRAGWAPATVKQAVSAVRSFFRWMAAEEGWREDPGRALVVPRVPGRLQRTLSGEEIAAMLLAADDGMVGGLRMGAMISLLVDSGVRAAELCGLDCADVNMERGAAKVVGKGGCERLVYFGQVTGKRLAAWIDVRAAGRSAALFVALGGRRPGDRLTTRGLRRIVAGFGERAGVSGVSPHTFRRAFACISTEAGAPSRVVMGAGGWSNLRMVETYTRGLETERLYREYSPADYLQGLKR